MYSCYHVLAMNPKRDDEFVEYSGGPFGALDVTERHAEDLAQSYPGRKFMIVKEVASVRAVGPRPVEWQQEGD
jgi:hypothetical protein